MKWVIEVEKSELINEVAITLMKVNEIKSPEWAPFVRTGTHKERPPVDKNWWYTRVAAILVKVVYKGPIGVSKLRTLFGGKKRRGHKPGEFRKSGGNIIRTSLQQLEKAGFVKQTEKGVHKGRIVTPAGQSFLNTIAKKIATAKPKTKIVEKSVDKKVEKIAGKNVEKKVETKPDSKIETKVETKSDAKAEIKSDSKTETKVETKTDAKAPVETKQVKETAPETVSDAK